VLRQLRERKLMTLKGRKVIVQDMGRLNELAGFQEQQSRPKH
jgi:hypothetical protein